MGFNTGITFTHPEALALLILLLPLAIYLSRTSLALLRRGRRRFSLGLRLMIVTLLVLSLAGVELVRASDRLSVVFLLDRSDSLSAQQKDLQAEYVRSALAKLGPNDSAGVVMFGADALVDRPVLQDTTPPDLASRPQTTYSNLGDAIRLGLTVAPADTTRRLVLLSDGKENAGSAEWAARLAAANGVPLDVVPLTSTLGSEVWVAGLSAPTTVRENESTSLQIAVQSTTGTTGTLTIFMDGQPLNSQEVTLVRGSNNFVQNLPPMPKGFHSYSAQIEPPLGVDTRRENNNYSAYSFVMGKARILMVEGHTGEAEVLRNALSTSADVDIVAPNNMPADVKSLAGYEGVVLVNVPTSSLSRSSLDSLHTAVRDLGKGLVVVGGDESYAAGGYFRTPLEDMLPVDLNLPSKLDIPSVGMVIVVDRSGSMGESHTVSGAGVTKLELAKEAAYRAVAQLSAKDYVGVVAFDSLSNWIVDLQPLGDPTRFKDKIGGINLGGGTNIYSGLAPAVDALVTSKAKSKHVILLTDGQSEGGDYDGLLKKMADNQITISTVAVGRDADTSFLQDLATRGKGRYYYTEEGNALPEIFAHESHLAARSYIIEHPFAPERVSPSPILDGLGGLPQLQGYVGTSPKPSGQLALVSDAGDPVLAQWQYGLGRVVAWTSDAKGQWAKDWVGWQSFSRFWTQAVRWSTGAEAGNSLQTRVEVEAGTAHITVDATAPDGSFLNDLNTQALIVSPGNLTNTVTLRQSAAGRYEGQFPATEEGVYILRVQASGKDTVGGSQTLGVVVPYSPEYKGSETDNGLLARLASMTGGRQLSLMEPTRVLDHTQSPVTTSSPMWPLLLLLAILLLPFDVGVRRVAVSRGDVARALDEVRRRFGWQPRPLPAGAHASTSDMAALFDAKSRSKKRTEVAQSSLLRDMENKRTPASAQDVQLMGRVSQRDVRQGEAVAQSAPPPVQTDEEVGDSSLAARLRRAREQRR